MTITTQNSVPFVTILPPHDNGPIIHHLHAVGEIFL